MRIARITSNKKGVVTVCQGQQQILKASERRRGGGFREQESNALDRPGAIYPHLGDDDVHTATLQARPASQTFASCARNAASSFALAEQTNPDFVITEIWINQFLNKQPGRSSLSRRVLRYRQGPM